MTWPRTNARSLTRRRFGRLLVIRETEGRASNGQILWLCRCDCGTEVAVMTSNLASGNTTSCGCYQREVSRKPNRSRKK